MDSAVTLDVTEAERLFFDAFGFAVWRGWYRSEIEAISSAFDEVFADEENPRWTMLSPGYRNQPRTAMIQFCNRHPRLAEMFDDPRPRAIAQAILGPDAACDQTGANIFDCESEWHPDSPTQHPASRHLKLQLYLEPLTADNGAPRVIPGSHHEFGLGRQVRDAAGFDGVTEMNLGASSEDLPSWAIETEPGDVVVWDFRTLHASFKGCGPRRALGMNWHAPYGGAPEPAPARPGQFAASGCPDAAVGWISKQEV